MMKRTHFGLTWCVLYQQAKELNQHLFLFCTTVWHIWDQALSSLEITQQRDGCNIMEAWNNCGVTSTNTKNRNLPLVICWNIWLSHNLIIFNDLHIQWPLVIARIINNYNELPDDDNPPPFRTITPKVINHNQPRAYFDGSAQYQGCGGAYYFIYQTNILSVFAWGWVLAKTTSHNSSRSYTYYLFPWHKTVDNFRSSRTPKSS